MRIGCVLLFENEAIAMETERNVSDTMAVAETIQLINNSNIKGLENMKVEFVTNGANGWIDTKTNTMYLNVNSQKAMKFVLGHELTHPMENNKAYKGVYDEIIDSLKANGTYQEIYNKTKALYTDQIKGKTKEQARKYINSIGGFEKFAEWGLY